MSRCWVIHCVQIVAAAVVVGSNHHVTIMLLYQRRLVECMPRIKLVSHGTLLSAISMMMLLVWGVIPLRIRVHHVVIVASWRTIWSKCMRNNSWHIKNMLSWCFKTWVISHCDSANLSELCACRRSSILLSVILIISTTVRRCWFGIIVVVGWPNILLQLLLILPIVIVLLSSRCHSCSYIITVIWATYSTLLLLCSCWSRLLAVIHHKNAWVT